MVEAVASEEPETAANPALAVTPASAIPPGQRPVSRRAASNRSRESPARAASAPISRKSGMMVKP